MQRENESYCGFERMVEDESEPPSEATERGGTGSVATEEFRLSLENIPNGELDELDNTNRCEGILLEWKNISYTVKSGNEEKIISKDLTGKANPGTLLAVMGPSGAGKSTLLNILTGYYETGYEGEVQVNGHVRIPRLFSKQSCYVMQEDCLLPLLTVKEALMVAAELRLPTTTSKADKLLIITDIMQQWGLEECQNTRSNQLSGGQRKRLAIAQELVSNPPVIFLDEPTSGLDSSSSLMCVKILKDLSARGHTVLCTIHQPSAKIFSYFDVLLK